MTDITRQQKKDFAQKLYLSEPGITQQEIAARVGVSVNTVSKWKVDGKWEEMRVSLLTSKDTILTRLYNQLDRLTAEQEDGKSVSADTIIKLTAAIRNLENETNIADKLTVGKEFLVYLRRVGDASETKKIAAYFDAFIKSQL